MTTNIFIIHEDVFLLYETMYSCYTRQCIITINIFIIHEDVFLLYEMMYNKNTFSLLYKRVYYDNKYSCYT